VTISTWSPISYVITNITQANPGVVTTAQPHGYNPGLYVRIDMQPDPALFGMTQVNNNVYLITILSPTTFSLNADTSNFDAFTYTTIPQAAQVIPVGEVALSLLNAEKNTLTPYGG
jgi:hypothetical protein